MNMIKEENIVNQMERIFILLMIRTAVLQLLSLIFLFLLFHNCRLNDVHMENRFEIHNFFSVCSSSSTKSNQITPVKAIFSLFLAQSI